MNWLCKEEQALKIDRTADFRHAPRYVNVLTALHVSPLVSVDMKGNFTAGFLQSENTNYLDCHDQESSVYFLFFVLCLKHGTVAYCSLQVFTFTVG